MSGAGRAADDHSMSEEAKERNRQRNRARVEKCRQLGICVQCGQKLDPSRRAAKRRLAKIARPEEELATLKAQL